MDYVSATFQSEQLGFEVTKVSGYDPKLGNLIINKIVPGGQADRIGLRVGDILVTLNRDYVAFEITMERFEAYRLNRPLDLRFARPNFSAWNRISMNDDEPVKSGTLEKQTGKFGLFHQWQTREFTLTKTVLSYRYVDVFVYKMKL